MLEQLSAWLAENWVKAVSVLTILTVIPTYLRARYLWRKRLFLTRINFSLNYVEDNILKFRTIQESNLSNTLLNNVHAIRMLLRAARSKRKGAFLLFSEKEAWTILTTLLNELSSQFASGYFARSMGVATRSEWFSMGVTCEKHPDLKTTKIRVMIVSQALLENLHQYVNLTFEAPHHHIRLSTLREMQDISNDKALQHNLAKLEICIPA